MLGKTGTTQNNRSAGFIGATPQYSGAVLVWPDGSHPAPICDTDPPRLCSSGDIFGGKVPARTWFKAMGPLHENLPVLPLPPTEPRYVTGAGPNVPNVVGQGENTAQLILERAGFRVKRVVSASDQPAGTIVSETPRTAQPGDLITISISDGTVQPQPAPRPLPPAAPYRPPQPPEQRQPDPPSYRPPRPPEHHQPTQPTQPDQPPFPPDDDDNP
jgi:membrane peptidoglycan carboxypeptidase